jgi:hypothetical protein
MRYSISKTTLDPNYKTAAPFHGDIIFIDTIYDILSSSKYFFETGTAHGDTLKFVCDNFKNLKAVSCEPDDQRYERTSSFIPDAEIVKTTSPQIFDYIAEKYPGSHKEKTVFWLDAHGEFNGRIFWPLRDEINHIKSNFDDYYILIDDFKNPFDPNFCFDTVNGVHCGLDYIRDLLDGHNLYFPSYTEKTSVECSNLVGWVLITKNELHLPNTTRIVL